MVDKINFKCCLVMLVLLLLVLCSSTVGKIIYVDDDAAGSNNGSSWENAYIYLQDALVDANSAEKPVEIRVAQGIYTPDRGMTQTLGDREATFRLINGVAICGGYAGSAESDYNDRDSDLYMSILSGDLEGNDVEAESLFDIALDRNTKGREENSKHVLIGSFTDETAVLDGFTITGGFGARRDDIEGGAGIDIESGSPAITNCIFTGNASFSSASALVNRGSSCPNLTNCSFSKNCSLNGTMGNHQSSPILTYCRFSNNSDDVIWNIDNSNPMLVDCTFEHNFDVVKSRDDCNVTLTNCIFISNSSRCIDHESGGRLSLTGCVFRDNSGIGIDNFADELVLTDCLFVHNISGFPVSAIDYHGDNFTLKNCEFRANSSQLRTLRVIGLLGSFIADNCIFSGNIVEDNGGTIEMLIRHAVISNCLFAGNVAGKNGGVIYAITNGYKTIRNCTFSGNTTGDGGGSLYVENNTEVINCIFWDERSSVIQSHFTEPLIKYCDVQGGWPGEGNIDVDPCFAMPGYWDQNGTPDDTTDDFWVDGDYHLKSQAGRWDPMSESWVVDDVTSPCIDAGDPLTPVMYEPNPRGYFINMGAYGGTEEASKSYIGVSL